MKRVEDGVIKAMPVVDGYEVANVFCLPHFRPSSSVGAFSTYYVEWVYSDPRWRRRGMARLAMEAALDHRWDRLCAATSLHTGTRNVAHALYRSCGLSDFLVNYEFSKQLHREPAAPPPKGVAIRRATAEDAQAVTELLDECYAHLPRERARLLDWPGRHTAHVATNGRRIVGVAGTNDDEGSAWLMTLAVADMKKADGKPAPPGRERVGRALLATAHRALLRRKVKSIKTATWMQQLCVHDGFVKSLLDTCGYATRRTDFVELYRVNRLDQYLDEISGTLELRLARDKRFAGWTGSIRLDGGRLKASIDVRDGKVSVAAKRPIGPNITVRGDEFSIQRIVLGVATPFEEYLQLQVAVSSCLGAGARDLLETMFPCVIRQF